MGVHDSGTAPGGHAPVTGGSRGIRLVAGARLDVNGDDSLRTTVAVWTLPDDRPTGGFFHDRNSLAW